MIWLSFGTVQQTQDWSESVRAVSPNTHIWVQTGSVKIALEMARDCAPDALVLQGGDAGGHGNAGAASIVTLVPETADALRREGHDSILLLAAGGIMDGRGVAAALTLGADGAVMGTRFLGAQEALLDPEVRNEVFSADDGGVSTARSRSWDEVWGHNSWPHTFDGRCLKNAMWTNSAGGLDGNSARSALYEDLRKAESGDVGVKDVSTIWAGTGVGLVKRLESAASIVDQVREEARNKLHYACAAHIET